MPAPPTRHGERHVPFAVLQTLNLAYYRSTEVFDNLLRTASLGTRCDPAIDSPCHALHHGLDDARDANHERAAQFPRLHAYPRAGQGEESPRPQISREKPDDRDQCARRPVVSE